MQRYSAVQVNGVLKFHGGGASRRQAPVERLGIGLDRHGSELRQSAHLKRHVDGAWWTAALTSGCPDEFRVRILQGHMTNALIHELLKKATVRSLADEGSPSGWHGQGRLAKASRV